MYINEIILYFLTTVLVMAILLPFAKYLDRKVKLHMNSNMLRFIESKQKLNSIRSEIYEKLDKLSNEDDKLNGILFRTLYKIKFNNSIINSIPNLLNYKKVIVNIKLETHRIKIKYIKYKIFEKIIKSIISNKKFIHNEYKSIYWIWEHELGKNNLRYSLLNKLRKEISEIKLEVEKEINFINNNPKIYEVRALNIFIKNIVSKYKNNFSIYKEIMEKVDSLEEMKKQIFIYLPNRVYLIKHLSDIKSNIDENGSLLEILEYLNLKIEDYKNVLQINNRVFKLKDSHLSLSMDMRRKYRDFIRIYNKIHNENPVILKNHLPNIRIDKDYYFDYYIRSVLKLIDISYKHLSTHNFKLANAYRMKCGDLKKRYEEEIGQIDLLHNKLNKSKSDILDYNIELDSTSDISFYNKVYNKVKGLNNCKEQITSQWNTLQDDIFDYKLNMNKEEDTIHMAERFKSFYFELKTLNRLIDIEIETEKISEGIINMK